MLATEETILFLALWQEVKLDESAPNSVKGTEMHLIFVYSSAE